jgi:dUTP pyrophosphatase
MSIARFGRVSPKQWEEAMGERIREAVPLEEIPLPRRATPGSAGYDFTAPAETVIPPGESALIPTGIRAEMEPGWVLVLFPRSSLGFKYGLRLANTAGVIDSDYYGAANEGHIQVRLTCDRPVTVAAGDRFCQGIFLPYGLAEEEDSFAGRTGGMGSTGK